MGRLLVALGVVAAACGGSTAAPTSTLDEAGATRTTASVSPQEAGSVEQSDEAGAVGESNPSGTSTSTSTSTRPRPEGRDAPDFVLALGQGGEFALSAESNPVYMVFWAEW